MPALWSPEDLAARFAPYIAELHDVFAMHGLAHGAPEDLLLLTDRLAIPGPLNEELASLVRSMVLREGGSIPRTDLLEIVAIAIAGPRMDPAGEELQQPVRQLLTFLHGALRRPWNQPPGDEPAAPSEDDLRAEAARELREAAARIEAEAQAQAPHRQPEPAAPHPAPQNVIPFGRARAVFSRLAREDAVDPIEVHIEDPIKVATADTTEDPIAALDAIAASPLAALDAVPPPARAAALPAAEFDAEPPLPGPPRVSRTALIYAIAAAILLATGLGLGLCLRPTPHASAAPPAVAGVPRPIGTAPPGPASILAASSKPIPTVEAAGAASASHGHGEDDGYVAAPYSTMPLPPDARPGSPSATPSPLPYPGQRAPQERSSSGEPAFPHPADANPSSAEPLQPTAVALAEPPLHPRIAGVVMAQNLLSAPKPDYPTLARLAHVDGPVVLHAEITRGGAVADTRVISGHHLLRHAAEDAVRHWRYRPYQVDGRPVPVSTTITVHFHH